MGIFGRLGTLVKANVNDAISKAEDPEKILNQLILDMKDQLIEAKKQVAVSIADEKRLKKQLDNELHKSREWEKKAMMAVRANRDDLAREALRRKSEHEELAEGFGAQWEAQKAASDQLKESLRRLDAKIAEARRRKQSLVSRKRQVEAQATIQRTMSDMSRHNPAARFDAFERRIDEEEVRLEAAREVDEATSSSDLNARFAAITREAAADDALAALKSKMRSEARGVHVSFEAEEEEEVTLGSEVHVSL